MRTGSVTIPPKFEKLPSVILVYHSGGRYVYGEGTEPFARIQLMHKQIKNLEERMRKISEMLNVQVTDYTILSGMRRT